MLALSNVFYKLMFMSAIATIVGIIIVIIRRLFDHKIPPIWKYLMWGVVILSLLVPYRPKSDYAAINYSTMSRENSIIENKEEVAVVPNAVNHIVIEEYLEEKREIRKKISYKEIIPIIWMIGVIVMLLNFLVTRFKLLYDIKKYNTDHTVDDTRFYRLLSECKNKVKVKADIKIKLQNTISSPAIMGRTILLPTYATDMRDESLQYILYHELGHYKRKDTILNAVLLLIQTVYWFNPIIWLLFKLIRDDMEVLNDEYVLKHIGQEKSTSYLKSLLEVLSYSNNIPIMPRLLCMVDGKKNMERRIHMIKLKESFKKHRMIISILCFVLIIILCMVFLTSKSVEHTVSIYALKEELKDMDAETIIKNETPIITEKEIKAYNPKTHMMFLSDNILNDYREKLKKQTKPFFIRGGSLILDTTFSDKFLIVVDGKAMLSGHFKEPAYVSSLRAGYKMIDCDEGIMILFEELGMKEDDSDKRNQLSDIFSDMNMLTEDIFTVGPYDVKKLHSYKVEYIGNNSKVGNIVSNLSFTNVKYQDFELKTDEKPYGITINLEGSIDYFKKEKNRGKLELSAFILSSLIGNVEEIHYNIIEGKEEFLITYYKEDYISKNSLEQFENIGSFYEAFQMRYDMHLFNVIDDQYTSKEIDLFVFKKDGKTCYKILDTMNDKHTEETIYSDYITDLKGVKDEFSKYSDGMMIHIYQMNTKDFTKEEMSKFLEEDLKDSIPDNSSVSIGLYKKSRDVDDEIKALVNEYLKDIMSSPQTSSNYEDYIYENQISYESILKLGDGAMLYMMDELAKNLQNDLKSYIMLDLIRELLGARDNVKTEDISPVEWYQKFEMRKETKLPDFEYTGEDENLKLAYKAMKNRYNDEGFSVCSIDLIKVYKEEEYTKLFVYFQEESFKLYDEELEVVGGSFFPCAITYKEGELFKIEEPMDGSYFTKSIKDFCKTPKTNQTILGLYSIIMDKEYSMGVLRDNLKEHLIKNKIKRAYIYDNYLKENIFELNN